MSNRCEKDCSEVVKVREPLINPPVHLWRSCLYRVPPDNMWGDTGLFGDGRSLLTCFRRTPVVFTRPHRPRRTIPCPDQTSQYTNLLVELDPTDRPPVRGLGRRPRYSLLHPPPEPLAITTRSSSDPRYGRRRGAKVSGGPTSLGPVEGHGKVPVKGHREGERRERHPAHLVPMTHLRSRSSRKQETVHV